MQEIEIAKSVTTGWLAHAREASPIVDDLSVENEVDQEFAAEILRDVKESIRQVEEKRKEITVPLNNALNAVNGLFRPAREALEALEKGLKQKIAGYLERKELANRAALELAAKSDEVEEAQQALALVDQSGPPKGVSVRYVWKFRVVDAELVPREYCSPDAKKIGAFDPGSAIPGVEWFQEPVVASRRT